LSFEEASSKLLHEICVKPGCILDVGAGSGKLALRIAKKCGKSQVVGVDISRTMLNKAHRYSVTKGIISATFIHACAEYLPFRDEVYDAVYSNFGLAHFNNPMASLDEMVRVLKKRGKVGIADYKHPVHITVHPIFKKSKPAAVVDWIAKELRKLGCQVITVSYWKEDFYVIVGTK